MKGEILLILVLTVFSATASYGPCKYATFISQPENDSFRKDLCFSPDVYFFRARNLRDAWADRLEILHDDQY